MKSILRVIQGVIYNWIYIYRERELDTSIYTYIHTYRGRSDSLVII